MTSLLLLLISHADQADAILARYEKTMRAMPTFEVQVTCKSQNRPDIHGELIIDGRKQLYYHATAPGVDYKLTISPAGYMEVDQHVRLYDEYPYDGTNIEYKSRISPIQSTLPDWLKLSNLKRLLPQNAKFTYVKKEMAAGRSCDQIHATITGPMLSGTIDCDVAADGLIYRFLRVTDSSAGHEVENWELDKYRPARSFSASRFQVTIPDGFAPYALPYNGPPAAVGTRPSLLGFQTPAGSTWNPPYGRPLLLVVAGHDSVPSDKALKAVSGWKGVLARSGIQCALLSDASKPYDAKGLLYDPHRTSIAALSSPSTPAFFLLNSKGVITNIWMGFDSTQSQSLADEIVSASTASKSK